MQTEPLQLQCHDHLGPWAEQREHLPQLIFALESLSLHDTRLDQRPAASDTPLQYYVDSSDSQSNSIHNSTYSTAVDQCNIYQNAPAPTLKHTKGHMRMSDRER
jgi:hypothetical protein